MCKANFFNIIWAIMILCLPLYGQIQATKYEPETSAKVSKKQFFPLSELREGMRGTARTVFRGTEAENFNVEILGIVPGAVGPKQDLIIAKISGGQADRTSVFAGMSGSPVFIDGKLVGAIAYSFPFAKEPICGITPIEQMINIFEQKQNLKKKSSPQPISFSELVSATWSFKFPQNPAISGSVLSIPPNNPGLAAVAGQSFQPIATPVAFSGFARQTLDFFAPMLLQAGLLPVSAAGGAARITPLKKADENTLPGGASVSMQLVRGDYSLAASGTVTLRDGEKIYAFGHPFLNLGTSDLPMAESHVVTVIPNLNNSFKLAVPGAMVGSMTQDRSTGVLGKLGQIPKMIPVQINLETSRGQTETLNFEVVKDDFLTPLLLNISIYNSLIANEKSLGQMMIELQGEIKIKGQNPIKLENRFGGMAAAQTAAAAVALPVNALLQSNFDELEITQISLFLNSTEGNKSAVLERITIDKGEVRVGETVEIQAFVRTDAGKVFVQKIPFQIPENTPVGQVSLLVGDGKTVQENSSIQQFVPKDLGELIATINKVKKSDRLYVQMLRTTKGVIIGANEMPNLPPSVLVTINNNRTVGGFKPTVQTVIVEQEIAPADFIISGQQSLTIEIIR
jgi:hypothetical protein